MGNKAFGHPRIIEGKGGAFPSTLVPIDLLGLITSPVGIPITVSGTSNRTFTVNASVSNPVWFWDGQDFVSLKETLGHDMGTGSTNTVIATTGALSSSQTPGSTGVKYYYLGMDTDGALGVHPSTVKPSYVEGAFPGTILGHPGVARDRVWRYVGFSFMSATTPVFNYFLKNGKVYNFSNHAYAGVDTQPGLVTLSVVPQHSGVRIGGFVTGQATGNIVELGVATDPTLTNAAIGIWKGMVAGLSAAAIPGFMGFDGIPIAASGNIVAHIDGTATNVNIHITKVYDVV